MHSSRNLKIGAIAVAAIALVGVGTAYATTKLHSGSGSRNSAPQSRMTPFGNGYHRGLGFAGVFGSFTAAANYLGLSQQQLFTEIRSGKTLAQIANATPGKSASGLTAAIVAAQKSALDSAVTSGRITRAMATQIESNLEARVTDMVNNGFGRFGGHGGGFGGGNWGNGFGTPPSAPPSHGQAGASPT